MTAYIYTASGNGKLGGRLYELTAPSRFAWNRANLFKAPAHAPLQADTRYLLTFAGMPGSAAEFRVSATKSDAEDSGTAAGWSIDDAVKRDGVPRPAREAFMISVNGQPYTFQVRAVNGASPGEGPAAEAMATPGAGLCNVPDLSDRRLIWTGTLAVARWGYVDFRTGEPTSELYGYGFNGPPTDTEVGEVSPDRFTVAGATYEVDFVVLFAHDQEVTPYLSYDPGDFAFSLDRALPPATVADLRLHVCDTAFDFSVAAFRRDDVDYPWTAPALDWPSVTERTLRLSLPSTEHARSAPSVEDVPVVTGPAGGDPYAVGDRIEARVAFTAPVTVDTAGGQPTLGIALGGVRRNARYESGSGDAELVFALTVAQADAGAREAAYAGGSGTTTLTFVYRLVEADGMVRSVLVPGNGVNLDGSAIRSTAGLDAELEHTGAGRAGIVRRDVLPVFDVADAQAPEGGTLAFRVTLTPPATGPVTVTYATSDGTACASSDYSAVSRTLAFKAGESEKTVSVAVTEDGETEASETLALTLSSPSGATIGDGDATGTITDAMPPARPPLAAELRDLPADYDGSTVFTVVLSFSEEIPGLSYKTVRDRLVEVTGGTVVKAPRIVKGSNRRFRLHVAPSGLGDVVIALATLPGCGEEGAVCTEDGRRLSGGVSVTIPGPSWLSVADASAREAQGATLDFVVTLSRARHEATEVDYRTHDGTATAGYDYTATSGTLTFAAGETSKTAEVAVLDDVHDEGPETLTLTLSNPLGARIADGTATGTIENSDAMSLCVEAVDTRCGM